MSQEAALISGYHDDANHLFNVDEPVVIFGDHTQVLKYVDFSFVMGADGVKILKPINDIDAKYFYYALKTLMPKGTGYARHYKLLKELTISYPPLAEQQRIVAKLDAAFAEIDRAIDTIEATQAQVNSLELGVIKATFDRFSEKLEYVPLEELCTKITDGVHKKPEYQNSGVPFLKINNLTEGSGISFKNISYISEFDHKQFIKNKPRKRRYLDNQGRNDWCCTSD